MLGQDDHLKSFVERIERLNEEKSAISEDVKDLYTEVKSAGFDTKILRKIIAMRKMETSDRQEQEALIDVYKHALEMDLPLLKEVV